ncbi:MAG: hypothetical protein GY861_17615 [bacterium]|nr:hypothetical protein [bacterium]
MGIINFIRGFLCSEIIEESRQIKAEYNDLADKHQKMQLLLTAKEKKVLELSEIPKKEILAPFWLTGKMQYKPKRRVVSKNNDVVIKFAKPQYAFDKSTYLYDLLKAKGFIGCKKTLENAQKIHDFLARKIKYEHDKDENWRPIADTLLSGFGDCEDSGGIVLTSAYGICGWEANEVFCACGVYDKDYGHAYCVVKIGQHWYVSEGTSARMKLKKWKDSPKYLGDWGVCNWKFQGMIDNTEPRIPDDDEV